jgi:putative flippase GtrA
MTKWLWNSQFAMFACVGAAGFVVDYVVFYLFSLYVPYVHVVRIVAFGVACLVTWWLNARFTFKQDNTSVKIVTLPTYFLAQSLGMLINFSTFSTLLFLIKVNKTSIFISFIVGSLVAMLFNFFFAKHITFKKVVKNDHLF